MEKLENIIDKMEEPFNKGTLIGTALSVIGAGTGYILSGGDPLMTGVGGAIGATTAMGATAAIGATTAMGATTTELTGAAIAAVTTATAAVTIGATVVEQIETVGELGVVAIGAMGATTGLIVGGTVGGARAAARAAAEETDNSINMKNFFGTQALVNVGTAATIAADSYLHHKTGTGFLEWATPLMYAVPGLSQLALYNSNLVRNKEQI
jgi:hypothetical protein